MNKLHLVLTAGLLLGACEARIGKGDDATASNSSAEAGSSPAAGKAKEGELSIKAPGFDMKVNIPRAITNHVNADSDDQLVYPGSSVDGLHIEASAKQEGKGDSGVELRFKTGDAFDKVAAWYRDPARRDGFSIGEVGREGNSLVIAGTQKEDGDPFRLQLSPAAGGGTEGRLTLSDGK